MDLSPVKKGGHRDRGSVASSPHIYVRSLAVVALCSLAILLFLSPALALTVTPAKQTLQTPGDEVYQFVYTVTNNDPFPQTVTLKPEPTSEYLQERITLQPSQFSLLPGASQNVQVSISPAGLGPQMHTLGIGAYDGAVQTMRFELSFTMPGVPVERYDASIVVEDITTAEPLSLEVTLRDFGNVIGYAQVRLELLRNDQIIGTIEYPDLLQVLPNKDTVITLAYTDRLEPGFYVARIVATYANATTRTEKPFSVTLGTTRQVVAKGSDIELSFASLGNPAVVVYALTDKNGVEQSSGSFLPETGTIIIPTSRLEAGEYSLSLRARSSTRTITVEVRDETAKYRTIAVLLACGIALAAIISLRRRAFFALRIMRLRYAIWQRERAVDKLINRAHKLVDRYAAHAARRNAATRSLGEARQGP